MFLTALPPPKGCKKLTFETGVIGYSSLKMKSSPFFFVQLALTVDCAYVFFHSYLRVAETSAVRT